MDSISVNVTITKASFMAAQREIEERDGGICLYDGAQWELAWSEYQAEVRHALNDLSWASVTPLPADIR